MPPESVRFRTVGERASDYLVITALQARGIQLFQETTT